MRQWRKGSGCCMALDTYPQTVERSRLPCACYAPCYTFVRFSTLSSTQLAGLPTYRLSTPYLESATAMNSRHIRDGLQQRTHGGTKPKRHEHGGVAWMRGYTDRFILSRLLFPIFFTFYLCIAFVHHFGSPFTLLCRRIAQIPLGFPGLIALHGFAGR